MRTIRRFSRVIFGLALFGVVLLGISVPAQASLLTNGDFETGDLSGWSLFSTVNGTPNYQGISAFDTNGDSTPSQSAQFKVGQVGFQWGVPAGGGIAQTVTTGGGTLQVTLDIAAYNAQRWGFNRSGGIFELYIDGVLVDSFDFGLILAQDTETAVLSGSLDVGAGESEIRIAMQRPYIISTYQYLDNIVATIDSPVPPETEFPPEIPDTSETPPPREVPAPSALAFFVVGLLALALLHRRRRMVVPSGI